MSNHFKEEGEKAHKDYRSIVSKGKQREGEKNGH